MRSNTRVAPTMMLLMTAACSSGSDSVGTTPTPTAATIAVTTSTTGTMVSITETRTATAVVRDAAGAAIATAPVTWTSNNAAVATVSGSGSSATITAIGNGAAVITAASGAAQTTISVDVAQKFATLTVTPAAPTLTIGATSTMAVVARDARNTAIGGVTGTTFATSDKAKALVDAAGVVTAIAPGTATVTASLTRDGVTATANASVTVSAPAALALTANVAATSGNVFNPTSVTVAVGGSVNYAFASNHNVLFTATSGAPTDIPVTASGTVNRVFGTIGTFNYTCSLHAGMNGSVIVAAPSIFAQMNGANERPTGNASTANGAAVFTRNGANVTYTVTYQGVASAPTGLHIHAPATSATTSGIIVDLLTTPMPNTSGVLTGSFTATNIRSIAGAPAISMDSLFVLLQTGSAYVNVHSSTFPAGEIRGQTGQP